MKEHGKGVKGMDKGQHHEQKEVHTQQSPEQEKHVRPGHDNDGSTMTKQVHPQEEYPEEEEVVKQGPDEEYHDMGGNNPDPSVEEQKKIDHEYCTNLRQVRYKTLFKKKGF